MNKQEFIRRLSAMIPDDADIHAPFAELEKPTYGKETSGDQGQVLTLGRNQNMRVKFEIECACNFEVYEIIKRTVKEIY